MRLIDGDKLFAKIKKRHDMFADCEYIGDIARRDELSIFMADIVNAPTIGTWISIKDSLPELYETVLFIGKTSYGAWFSAKRGWWDGSFWHRDPGETVYSTTPVTHWMPLPKPPKENE